MAALMVIGATMTAPAAGAATITDDEYKARYAAAISLHDSGQFAAAVAAFRDLLAARPDDPNVLCELANSCMAAGNPAEAARLAERGLGLPGSIRPFCANILASSLDDQGEYKKGEKIFRQAIKESPKAPLLHFNLGINQAQQNRMPEAIEEYEAALRLNPGHAGGWRALAIAWQNTKARPRAFAAFARFLTLEPTGVRAEWAAKQLQELLFQGVENKGPDPDTGKGQINITLEAGKGKKIEAVDALSTGMSIVAASRWLDEWKDQSDAVYFAHAFESVVSIFEEMDTTGDDKSHFWSESVLPYFRAARKAGHLEAMAWDIRRSQKDVAIASWLEAHADQVGNYRTWSSGWKPEGR
jgi:tetratricopeptide (TPR) repeat protein